MNPRYVTVSDLTNQIHQVWDTKRDQSVMMGSGNGEVQRNTARNLNNMRYVAEEMEDENLGTIGWGVWNQREEEWVNEQPMAEDAAEQLAEEMTDNICAICGEQCDEAHSQTRYGRVCEGCTDEFVDDSGEVDWCKVRS